MNYELPARQALPVRHEGVSGGPGEAGGRIMGIRKKLFLAVFLFLILPTSLFKLRWAGNSSFLIPVFAQTSPSRLPPPAFSQYSFDDERSKSNLLLTKELPPKLFKFSSRSGNLSNIFFRKRTISRKPKVDAFVFKPLLFLPEQFTVFFKPSGLNTEDVKISIICNGKLRLEGGEFLYQVRLESFGEKSTACRAIFSRPDIEDIITEFTLS